MIDPTSEGGAHAIERLDRELIAWLTTVTPDGQPQTLPIWFIREGGTILFYGKRSAARNVNLRANSRVSFHLADDGRGDDIVEIEGEARLDPAAPRPSEHAAYLAKYADLLGAYEWTPEYFAAAYPHPYRIVPSVVRAF
jgi:PPOX class probable F420-dependent enzyme